MAIRQVGSVNPGPKDDECSEGRTRAQTRALNGPLAAIGMAGTSFVAGVVSSLVAECDAIDRVTKLLTCPVEDLDPEPISYAESCRLK